LAVSRGSRECRIPGAGLVARPQKARHRARLVRHLAHHLGVRSQGAGEEAGRSIERGTKEGRGAVNPKLRRILAWVGYPLFYLGCLMVFAYVSAPWDRLKNALVTGFNAGSPLRMEIEKLSWSWHFPGISARG